MEMAGEIYAAGAPPLTDLVASLEHAASMAKRLTITTDASRLQQIYNSLSTAHHQLSSFLSLPHRNPNLPATDENSDPSAINSIAEPMQVGDEEEVQNSKSGSSIDQVEEKMRAFFIRKKRPKRKISPSSAAAAVEQTRVLEDVVISRVERFDANETRLRNLELICQFYC